MCQLSISATLYGLSTRFIEQTAGNLVNYQPELSLLMEALTTPKVSSSEQRGTHCLIATRFLHVAMVIGPPLQKQRKLVSWSLFFVMQEETSRHMGSQNPISRGN